MGHKWAIKAIFTLLKFLVSDDFIHVVARLVNAAEQQFSGTNQGAHKKQWVLEQLQIEALNLFELSGADWLMDELADLAGFVRSMVVDIVVAKLKTS